MGAAEKSLHSENYLMCLIHQCLLQEKATDDLVSLIKANKDRYRIVIVGLHTLGKEDLLVNLATRLRQWVGVSEERMSTLELLELPNVFTTDIDNCFIQVYPFFMVAKNW